MPFRELSGHQRPIALLARSIHEQSLPPSLIFAGPSGIGKREVAVAVAQALNCLSPITGERPRTARAARKVRSEPVLPLDACGECVACRRIARSIHPDVLMVVPGETGSIRVDQVRGIIDQAAYRPFEGRRRVVIIDDADALVAHAQNALLKTLEEPPPSSVFILVTSMPDALLPTVRSRCPQVRFRPVAAEDIAAELVRRGQAEPAARAVAAVAEGSFERALDLSVGDLVAARGVAERALARAAASADPRRRLEAARDLLPKGGGARSGERAQLASYLQAMASLLRDAELVGARPDSVELANADLRPLVEQLTHAYRGDRGIHAFGAIDRALGALEGNASPKIVADWIMLQL
jgi:DNA polymerase III subunit delta'